MNKMNKLPKLNVKSQNLDLEGLEVEDLRVIVRFQHSALLVKKWTDRWQGAWFAAGFAPVGIALTGSIWGAFLAAPFSLFLNYLLDQTNEMIRGWKDNKKKPKPPKSA